MHSVLLKFAHLLWALRLWVLSWFSWGVVKMHRIVRKPCFEVDKKSLKLPVHIAFLIQESDISTEDIANLVVWSMAMGIQVITLYDVEGSLKSTVGQLLAAVSRRKQEFLGQDAAKFDICVNSDSNSKGGRQHVTRVNIVSASDGRKTIVSTAKWLCTSVAKKQLAASHVDLNSVDEKIKETLGGDSALAEPNLAVCCGPTASTLGFLPWHIRLTEILSLRSHHKVEYSEFLSVLRRFARTEQRFGV